jgi:hypothetical protein
VADFSRVKAEHSLESVAERLGLKLKQHGAQFRGPCPSGQGDERALVLTPGKGWWSHAAKKGGSVIDLVAFVKDLSPKDAAVWIDGQAQPEKSASGSKSTDFKPVELEHDHPMVLALGFTAEDAQRFGIGYKAKAAGAGNVLIPVFAGGKLAGYIGATEIAWLPEKWRA